MATTVATQVTIVCPECKSTRRVTARQRRRMLNDGADDRCLICRSPRYRNDRVVDQHHRNYWLDNYPLEWIKEVGEMIWGPPK